MMNIIKFLSVSRPKGQTSALSISADLCSLLTRYLSIMFCYHLYCFCYHPPKKEESGDCSAGPCFRDLLYLKIDWNWEWATLYIHTFFCTNEYPTLWRNSPKIILHKCKCMVCSSVSFLKKLVWPLFLGTKSFNQ